MEKLILGMKGKVICLNKRTGEIIWSTKIKFGTITNVHFDNDAVFAYSGGHIFCLSALDGSIKWENQLRGFGYGPCIIAGDNQSAVVASQVAAQNASRGGASSA